MSGTPRSRKRPNTPLARLLDTAAISRKALATRVNHLSALAGTPTAYTHSSVANWLGGMSPRPPAPTLIAAVLTAHLGRPVHLDEIGMGAPNAARPDLGLEFPRDPDDALAYVTHYWSSVERRRLLAAPFAISAYTSPTVRWITTPADHSPQRSGEGRRVGRADVEHLWAEADRARSADARYGGGSVTAVLDCLKRAMPLLHGTYTAEVGRDLFAATAELARVAGWAAVDMGEHATGQRHLIQALRLARAGGDVDTGAYVLSTMALQSFLRGHLTEAIDMADAAHERARNGAPRVRAFALMASAHAHGRAGNAREASTAIATAENLIDRIHPHTRDPAWLGYLNTERIASDASEIFRDLGQPKVALRWSNRAAPMPADIRTRSVGLRTAVEATAHAQLRDLDQGLATADRALDILSGVRSTRARDYLRDVADALRPWSREPRVADFLHRAAAVLTQK
ncbi:sporulation protein [Streptomyces sp. NPDC059816]|uniref:sporulation protein n=1 Tax=Streptomyces sp. NPDC059816 TaxID=3346960 RepID=UPI0036621597